VEKKKKKKNKLNTEYHPNQTLMLKIRVKIIYALKNIFTEPTVTKFIIIANLIQPRRNPRNNNYSVA